MTAEFSLCAEASELSVRALLAEMRARLGAADVPQTVCGTVETVLAEALNNIVEHAYDGSSDASIHLSAALDPRGLRVILSDRGAPLPGLALPAGAPPDMTTSRETLPEGGFGWFLIRSLTRTVRYARDGDMNHLTLWFDLSDADGADA